MAPVCLLSPTPLVVPSVCPFSKELEDRLAARRRLRDKAVQEKEQVEVEINETEIAIAAVVEGEELQRKVEKGEAKKEDLSGQQQAIIAEWEKMKEVGRRN